MILLDKADLHVPTSLVQNVVITHFINEFRLYLLMKSMCSGKMKLPEETVKTIMSVMKVKTRSTITARLSSLIHRNWIGFNPKTGIYFIRGFNAVCRVEGINTKHAVVYSAEDCKDFVGFVGAVLFLNFYKSVKRGLRNGTVTIKGVTKQFHKATPLYLPVSIGGISKSLRISSTYVHKLKQRATKAGLLMVEQSYTKLRGIPQDAAILKRIRPFAFEKGNALYIREVDCVYPLLRTSKRRC